MKIAYFGRKSQCPHWKSVPLNMSVCYMEISIFSCKEISHFLVTQHTKQNFWREKSYWLSLKNRDTQHVSLLHAFNLKLHLFLKVSHGVTIILRCIHKYPFRASYFIWIKSLKFYGCLVRFTLCMDFHCLVSFLLFCLFFQVRSHSV